MVKTVFIDEIKKPQSIGREISETFFLRSITDESNGKQKYEALLSDKTGSIKCVLWEESINPVYLTYAEQVVFVKGKVEKYRGNFTINISSLSLVNNYSGMDYCDHVDDIEKQYQDFVEMYSMDIKKPHLLELLDKFYKEETAMKKFKILQGGKTIHHSRLGGYIEHLTGVHEGCKFMASTIPNKNICFDLDILLCAADLHDVGKIKEYKPLPYNEITDEGFLIGHLNLSLCMVYRAIAELRANKVEFPKEDEIKLLHLIATSHSAADDIILTMQNPRPSCPEAIILSKVDAMNAKVEGFVNFINNDTNEGNITKFSGLYQQFLYKG